MKKVIYFALAVMAFSSCQTGPKFNVSGNISGAKGKKLYLEASALSGIVTLDSIKLGADGSFSFKQPRPESPEFYRLRMDDNRIINISIDSIEKIRVNAPYEGFSTNYQV
ncbi:MAG: DUF4369 domain-containing protein, partial [Bacteroidaceae bacterium]